MDENIVILKCGALIQAALTDEADAIKQYSEQLAKIAELDPSIAERCAPIIEEIISDELNHQTRLHALYKDITGIAEAEG